MKDDGCLQGPVVHAVHHRLEGTLKVNRRLVRRMSYYRLSVYFNKETGLCTRLYGKLGQLDHCWYVGDMIHFYYPH